MPPAGCCRSRRATARGATAGRGSRSTATMTSSTIAALGIHSMPSEPDDEVASATGGADRPARSSTSSAQPAHTNDIASVTMMSGTRVTTTRPPLMAPRTRPRSSTPTATTDAELRALALHRRPRQRRSSAPSCEPIERSIPPEMTTIAWATAARASGRTEMARPWTPGGVVAGLDELGEDQQHGEQREQPERPRVASRAAKPTALRRARAFGVAPAALATAHWSLPDRLRRPRRSTALLAAAASAATASAATSSGSAGVRVAGCTPRAAASARRRPRRRSRPRPGRRRSRSPGRRRAGSPSAPRCRAGSRRRPSARSRSRT